MHIAKKQKGFTIIEILVVIVIIGILALITWVAYSGFKQRAQYAAAQAEAKQIGTQVALYSAENGSDPKKDYFYCEDGQTPGVDCIYEDDGSGNFVDYDCHDDGSCYYEVWPYDDGDRDPNPPPDEYPDPCYGPECGGGVICPATGEPCEPGLPDYDCPTGFIDVPGSARYATAGFCVMKYEAKSNIAETVIESKPDGLPYNNITQNKAIIKSKLACTGCRLISELEWLTIADNVFYTASNWSSGTVGSGYIFSGHNDGNPIGPLEASTDDNGYYGTNNYSGDTTLAENYLTVGNSQRRTLELSNGEIIWDFAGNVQEFTSGTISNHPGLKTDDRSNLNGAVREWDDDLLLLGDLPNIARPPAGFNSSNGIGSLSSNMDWPYASVFARGGNSAYVKAGIYALDLYYQVGSSSPGIGFRAVK